MRTFPPVYPHEMEVSVVIVNCQFSGFKPPSSDGKRLWPFFCAGKCVAGTHTSDYPASVQRAGRKDRIRRFVARTSPYVRGNPAASCRQRLRAARQGTVIAPGADGVPRPTQALLGAAFLGSGLLLHHQRQHHGRCHTSVSSGARTYRRQPVVIQCAYYDKCRGIGDDHRPAYDENTNQSAMPKANAVCVIRKSAGYRACTKF
jgi:hypothetical protein